MTAKRWLRALMLAAGCALIAAVVARVPFAELRGAAGLLLTPWVLLTPLLAVGWIAAGTSGMRVVVGPDAPAASWRALFWNRFVGDGYNSLLPLGVAGEAWKAQHLGAIIGTERAVVALVRDRFAENVVALIYSAVAVAVGLWRFDLAPVVAGGLCVYVAAALVLALVEGAFVLSRWPSLLGGRVARWLGHAGGMPGAPLERRPIGQPSQAPARRRGAKARGRSVPVGTRLTSNARDAARSQPGDRAQLVGALKPGQFARAAGWALVGRALGCLEVMILFHVLDMPAGVLPAFFAHGALAAAGFIGFFVPAGAGVTEAASVIVFEALGGPPGSAVVFALIRRARLVLVSLAGVSLHLGKVAAVRWLRALGVIAVIAGCIWFVRGLNPQAIWNALSGALVWPIAVAAVLSFGNMFWKAVCWRVMLAPVARVPMMRIYRYTLVAFAASTIAPARAGEVLRVWLLKRRDGVPATASAAIAVAEKLVDGLAMLLVVAPIPWLLPDLPAWVSKSILALFVIGVVALVAIWIVLHRAHPQRWLGKFVAGMEVLRRPRGLFLALAACVAAWITDLIEVWLVLYAVGVHIPWAGGLVILLTVNMALFVPSTPAHVGAFEIGALAALDVLGVPRAAGVAFALLYHAMQVVPLMLVGLFDIRLALDARLESQAAAQKESEAAAGGAVDPSRSA